MSNLTPRHLTFRTTGWSPTKSYIINPQNISINPNNLKDHIIKYILQKPLISSKLSEA